MSIVIRNVRPYGEDAVDTSSMAAKLVALEKELAAMKAKQGAAA